MMEATLSPRRLLDHLHATLRLDDELIDGFVLTDCFRLVERDPVHVELRRIQTRERFELRVEPSLEGGPRPVARTAGLDVSYGTPAPERLAEGACRRFTEHLERSLGSTPRRWTMAAPSVGELPTQVAAELRVEPADLDRDPDHELLRRDFANYERLYGVRPEAVEIRVEGRDTHGISIWYPAARDGRVPNSGAVYPLATRIAHRRRMRRYFANLGCVVG